MLDFLRKSRDYCIRPLRDCHLAEMTNLAFPVGWPFLISLSAAFCLDFNGAKLSNIGKAFFGFEMGKGDAVKHGSKKKTQQTRAPLGRQ
jgi:hypothetical protein